MNVFFVASGTYKNDVSTIISFEGIFFKQLMECKKLQIFHYY